MAVLKPDEPLDRYGRNRGGRYIHIIRGGKFVEGQDNHALCWADITKPATDQDRRRGYELCWDCNERDGFYPAEAHKPPPDLPPVLSDAQRKALSRILGYALSDHVTDERADRVRSEFESCLDRWCDGSFIPPSEDEILDLAELTRQSSSPSSP